MVASGIAFIPSDGLCFNVEASCGFGQYMYVDKSVLCCASFMKTNVITLVKE